MFMYGSHASHEHTLDKPKQGIASSSETKREQSYGRGHKVTHPLKDYPVHHTGHQKYQQRCRFYADDSQRHCVDAMQVYVSSMPLLETGVLLLPLS